MNKIWRSSPGPVVSPRSADVAILGCGISGLVTARILARQGVSVILLDQYPAAGGNHISVAAAGRIFDIGTIHFTGKDSFFDLFPEVKSGCLERRLTAQKLSADMKVRRFPLEASDIWDLSPATQIRVLASLLFCRMRRGPCRDASDFMERAVGREFFQRSGLRHYAERLFGTSPEEIDKEFGERRLNWLKKRTSVRANVDLLARRLARPRRQEGSTGDSAGLVRSVEGFAAHYGAAVNGLKADGAEVHLGLSFQKIAQDPDGKVRVETDRGDFIADRLVSTMPVQLASRLAGLPAPDLVGIDLLSLFVLFEEPCSFSGTVLYNFHQEGGWKRLTVFSQIYGSEGGTGHLTVEVPRRAGKGGDACAAFARFAQHVREAGLFKGELRLVGYYVLSDAYPLLDKGCGARRRSALRQLAEAGIDCVGRHGTFDYIPHQTVACNEAQTFARSKAQERPSPASR